MKFRVVHTKEDGFPTILKLTELTMQLEDMEGAHVNGRNSLHILKEALSSQRSKNYGEVLESSGTGFYEMVAHTHLVEYTNVALTNAGPWNSCLRYGFVYYNKEINK